MTILRIHEPPSAVLRQVATPIESVNDAVRTIFDDMLETMYDDNGIGLAAPQVGISKRLITMDLQEDVRGVDERNAGNEIDINLETGKPKKKIYYIANPEVVWESDETDICMEGCLSVPGMFAEVVRPAQVHVKYLDYNGKEQIMKASGLLSACIQHEIDHLDGVLFIDYLSKMKKDRFLKKLKKSQKERGMI